MMKNNQKKPKSKRKYKVPLLIPSSQALEIRSK